MSGNGFLPLDADDDDLGDLGLLDSGSGDPGALKGGEPLLGAFSDRLTSAPPEVADLEEEGERPLLPLPRALLNSSLLWCTSFRCCFSLSLL